MKTLSIGGGILELEDSTHLFYEPLGNYCYLVYWEGEKAIVKAEIIEATKDTEAEYYLTAFGQKYQFGEMPIHEDGELLRKLLHIPNYEDVEKWVAGEFKLPKKSELYLYLKNYFRLFGDYEAAYHPTILTLFTLQTYFLPLLVSCFFVNFSGAPGSGKTTLLLAACEVSYRGLPADSCSPAFRTRYIGRYGCPMFQDELDVTEKDDGLGLALARTSYRRGLFYARWDPERNQPELVEHFSPMGATYRVQPNEDAFLTRSLTEIGVSESVDYRLPIVNNSREGIARKIATYLYLSRFEILDKALHTGLTMRDSNIGIAELAKEDFDPKNKRTEIFSELTKLLEPKQQELLKKIFGRANELAYVAVLIAKLLEADVLSELIDAINIKVSEDSLPKDDRELQLIEILTDRAEVQTATERMDGIRLRPLTMQLEEWCKERKLEPPKTNTISQWMKEWGFSKEKGTRTKKGGDITIKLTDAIVKRLSQLGDSKAVAVDKVELLGGTRSYAVEPRI